METTTTTTVPAAHSAPAETFAHRSALDGLRGVAVAAVVAYHLGWLRGGYLGVDAFFVLSGYLITALLIDERNRTNATSLARFWERRAKRLIPGVVVLIAAVTIWGSTFAYPEQRRTLQADGIASLLYVANWRAVFTSNAYWDAGKAPSVLEHLWSLAIEEQFYVLWPLVFVGLWNLARGHRLAMAAATVGLAAASATAMVVLYANSSTGDPNRVYLGTDTRAQAVLIGAAAALVLAQRHDDERWGATRRGAGTMALLCAAVMWVAVDGADPWLYRGGFTFHAVLIALVVTSITTTRGWARAALSHPTLQWLGRISYGLYLWHWPVIVWLTPESTGLGPIAVDLLRIGVSLAAALLSYYLVEQPIRRSRRIGRRLVTVATPVVLALSCGALVLAVQVDSTDLSRFAIPFEQAAGADAPVAPGPGEEEVAQVSGPLDRVSTPNPSDPPNAHHSAARESGTVNGVARPVIFEPGRAVEIVFSGDSVGVQVLPYLEFVLGDQVHITSHSYPGTALCDWIDELDQSTAQAPALYIIDHGGNALSPCMGAIDGDHLVGEAYRDKYRADGTYVVDMAKSVDARLLFVGQPARRTNEATGAYDIFQTLAANDDTGSISFVSTWDAVSPGGFFVQSAPCDSTREPGCEGGRGELRSRPPGEHLEPLGAWRYALAVRDHLIAIGWLPPFGR